MLAVAEAQQDRWHRALSAALAEAGVDAAIVRPGADPAEVEFLVYAPNGPVDDFSVFPRLRAVLSTWAGVERVVNNPTLRVPLTRMVDPGLTQGMTEYVLGHVLRFHLGTDRIEAEQDGIWRGAERIPPLAGERRVGVLGLGALGAAAARALAGLGFEVHGWARRPRELPGVRVHHGAAGLDAVLERAEILVLLLPHTPQTENILDARAIARLPAGATVINPGRGALIDDEALLAALDSGHLRGAVLDVFRTEPLPPDHPFWRHPRVLVTPHVAADTRPESAARVIAENIRRFLAGEPPLHLVDRAAGY
ncbi:MAG: glyoxylate/hydroxypyruvate reductase A [Alphaproteobacteria bacterium]|nr:MAG: glyoxylate/hydroxypyruvate reductase A [Alphaproteobacteria bacterium]